MPIQVNRFLAQSDGMKVVESAKLSFQGSPDGLIFKELDRYKDTHLSFTMFVIQKNFKKIKRKNNNTNTATVTDQVASLALKPRNLTL